MEKKYTLLLILIIISGSLFFVSNHHLRGYLRSEVTLAKEIKTPLDSISQYRIASEAPFKYRLLFPAIVKTSFELFYNDNDINGFFNVYRFWSLLFFISSVCAFYGLMLRCGFDPPRSFFGACIFLSLPAILFAFTLPVHTREDTMAYTLLFLGLMYFIRGRTLGFVVISVLGAMCRETLLILPLLFLIYARGQSMWTRVAIFSMPVLTWIVLRSVMDKEPYDVWLGFRWNISNPEQVAGFLFISFSFCWAPFFRGLLSQNRVAVDTNVSLQFFYRSAWLVLALIVVTTFFGGIYNEVRLLHLMSPWIIIIAIDFLMRRDEQVAFTVRKRQYLLFAAASIVFCGIILYILIHNRDQIIVPGKYAVPYDLWIISSVCYIFIFLLLLPITLSPSLKKSDP